MKKKWCYAFNKWCKSNMGKENFELYFIFLGTNLVVRISVNPYFKLSNKKIVTLF